MDTESRLKPEDYHRFRSPGEPRISPDGSRLVYAVSRIDADDDERYVNLWLVDLEDESRRQLTVGEHRDTAPAWSPEGNRVAFLSDRTGKQQIWIIDVRGGEAWRIETEEEPSGPPTWSPDGTAIAFTARVFRPDDDYKPYPQAPDYDRQRAVAQAEGKEEDEEVSDVKVITRLRYRFDGIGYFKGRRNQVFVVGVSGPEDEDAPQSRQLTDGNYDHNPPLTWSPDGRYVAFSALRREDADQFIKSDLWAVDVLTQKMVRLMEGSGMVSSPSWSPDGQKLAFVGHDGAHHGSSNPGLWLLQVDVDDPVKKDQAEARELTQELDRSVGVSPSSDVRYTGGQGTHVEWDERGEWLYFTAADHGESQLYRADLSGNVEVVERAPGGEGSVTDFTRGPAGKLILKAGRSDLPDELWLRGAGGDVSRLTHENDGLLDELWVGRAEKFTYSSFDGKEIEGFLIKPRGYLEGAPHPAVLFIHGGPHGVYGQAFMFQCQILAAQGMAVFYTNPRGSRSYGQDFVLEVVEDWGGGDYRDIMAGVDHLVERGVIDEDRLGVTGWSYGGFMTSWTVTRTDRFVAGIIGAPVSDRYSFYGTSDIGYNFGEHHTGGRPWDGADKLLERSPVRYAERVHTPVMIVNGEGDLRCPVAQGEEFYLALKRLGREAVMVRYPGEFHGIRKPSHCEDRYRRYKLWFEDYLDLN